MAGFRIKNIQYTFCGFLLFFFSYSFNLRENFGIDLSNTHDFESWESVAVYFNNMLQPILLGASVFLLYKTWRTSQEELKVTNEHLRVQTNALLFEKNVELLPEVINEIEKFLKEPIPLDSINDYKQQVPFYIEYQHIDDPSDKLAWEGSHSNYDVFRALHWLGKEVESSEVKSRDFITLKHRVFSHFVLVEKNKLSKLISFLIC